MSIQLDPSHKWLFEVTDFKRMTSASFLDDAEDEESTLIAGRFLEGSIQTLGPQGLGLNLSVIPCVLFSGEKELMKLKMAADLMHPDGGGKYRFISLDRIPENFRGLSDVVIRLDPSVLSSAG